MSRDRTPKPNQHVEALHSIAAQTARVADEMRKRREEEERRKARAHADRPGHARREPRPIGELLLTGLVRHGQFTRHVPAKYWERDADRVTVDCPCGQKLELTLAQIRVCECERAYVDDGRRVRVAPPPAT